jgi:hypothetical protein
MSDELRDQTLSIIKLAVRDKIGPGEAADDILALPAIRDRMAERDAIRAAALEEAAKVAAAHKGSAARKRLARGQRLSSFDDDAAMTIATEERGEGIAAEIIERSIRALIPAAPPAPVAAAREHIQDVLMDSQYRAGVTAGWNAAQADDPNAALAQLQRRGSLEGFAEAKAIVRRADAATPPAPVVTDAQVERACRVHNVGWSLWHDPQKKTAREVMRAALTAALTEAAADE